MRFAALGPFLIDGAAARLRLAGRKERQVLAMLLASRNRVLPESDLVAGLWGVSPPPSAPRTLQAHISRVRAALPVEVQRSGSGWQLVIEDGHLDVASFEALLTRAQDGVRTGAWVEAAGLVDRALALWRGEPFDGFRDVEPCAAEAARLAVLREAAEDVDAECRLALGGAGDLVDRLRALTGDSPFRERRWAMLMMALVRSGRQREALDAYGNLRALLREELGVDPSQALQRLHAQVLTQDRALLAPLRGSAGEVPAAPWPGLAPYGPTDAAVFAGRERVLGRVLGRLAGGGVVVLAGVSGSGKSSLVLGGMVPALRAGGLPGSEAWSIAVTTPAASRDALPAADLLVLDQAEELFTVLAETQRRDLAESLEKAVADGIRLVVTIRADYWPHCATEPALMRLVGESSMLVAALTDEELRRVVVEPARRYGVTVDDELVDQLLEDVGGRDGCLPLVSTALARAWPRRTDERLTAREYHEAGGVANAVGEMAEECWAALDHGERRAARQLLLRLAGEGGTGVPVRRTVPVGDLVNAVPGGGPALRRLSEARLVTIGERGAEVVHESLFTAWPRLARWLEEDTAARRLRAHLTPAASEWAARGRTREDLYRGSRLAEAIDTAAGGAGLSPLERQFLDASEQDADAERLAALDRADREARTAQRLRMALAGLVALLLVAGTVAFLAVRSREKAVQAETEAVAGRLAGRALLEPDVALALLLAREAVALDDSPASRSALFGVLAQHPALLSITDVGDRATALRLEPSGREVVTCTVHGEIAARRMDELSDVRVVRPAGGNLCGPLAFLDRGRSVATVRQVEVGAALEVWSYGDGALRASVPLADGWYTFASADSSTIVVGSTLGGYLVRQEDRTWSPISWGTEVTVTNIVGRRVATSRPGQPIAVRVLPTGRIVQRVPGTRDQVGRALSRDGELAVTVGDREVRLIDARTGRRRLAITTSGPLGDVAFVADDRLLLTTTADGQAQVWRRDDGHLVAAVGAGRGGLSADVTQDGRTVVTLAEDGTLATWDLTGERTFGRESPVPTDVVAAARTDDASLVMGTAGGDLHRLGAEDLTVLDTLEVGGRVLDVEPAGPGRVLVVVDETLLELAIGERLSLLGSQRHPGLSDVAWHPDAGLALATDEGRSVTFVRNGRSRTVALTDTTGPAGPVRHEMWGHVARAPGGDLAAVATNDGQVHVLESGGDVLVVVPPADVGPTPALGVGFLDDRTLLIGDRRGRLTQWDPRTGEEVRAPTVAVSGTAHRLSVADGLVAVGSTGAGVGLVDARDRILYGNDLLNAGGELMVPVLAPDLTLTVLDPRGSARQWPGSVADWAERACRLAGRRLSRVEWAEHLGERPYDPAC